MSVLHTINKSSFSHTTLASCLQACRKHDAIILLEDGVFTALRNTCYNEDITKAIALGIKIYAIANDINARGLQQKIRTDILITDYNGFVQLSIKHNCVTSWY